MRTSVQNYFKVFQLASLCNTIYGFPWYLASVHHKEPGFQTNWIPFFGGTFREQFSEDLLSLFNFPGPHTTEMHSVQFSYWNNTFLVTVFTTTFIFLWRILRIVNSDSHSLRAEYEPFWLELAYVFLASFGRIRTESGPITSRFVGNIFLSATA